MKIFPIVVKRGGSLPAAGSASWLARVTHGWALSPTVTGTLAKPPVTTGVALTQAPARLATMVSAGRSLVASVTGSTTANIGRGVAVAPRMTWQGPTVGRGVELMQTKIDLLGTYGAATATSTQTSGAAWTNPANAQGARNGTLSSHAGSATSAQDATLTFAYPAVTGKDALTITKVEVRFYVSQTGTTLNNGGLTLSISTNGGGAYTDVNVINSNVDSLTTPLTYDVTASFPTFASLGNLRTRVRHAAALAALTTGNVDAVELVVTATRTDLL